MLTKTVYASAICGLWGYNLTPKTSK